MWLFLFLSLVAAVWWSGLFAADQRRKPAEPQPIPFSHKTHVALGHKCLDCHAMPEPGDLATFPGEAKCMACHTAIKTDSPEIVKLADFHKKKKPAPWVRIYKVPDYVLFSHKQHHRKAEITCETCHGPVSEREVMIQEKPVTMAACMDCHDEMQAPNECNTCHNP